MRNRLLFAGKIAVSGGLIAFLVYRVDLAHFYAALRRVRIELFALGLLTSAASVFVRAYKWQLLLNPHGKRFSVRELSAVSFISLFFNNFFLGSLGGDIYKFYITGSGSASRTGPASSIIMDRATGVLVLALTAAVAGVFIHLDGGLLVSSSDLRAIGAACLAIFIATYAGFRILFRVGEWGFLKRFPKLGGLADDVAASTKIYAKHRGELFAACLLGFLCILLTSFALYLYSRAAHVEIRFLWWLFVNPIVSFLAMLPVSANGLGVQEGAFMVYLSRLGVDAASALLIALLPRIEVIALSILGGILYLFRNGGSMGAVEADDRLA